jgi:hypothetical protein
MSKELLSLLISLDEMQRSEIKRCLSLDVSRAINIIQSGGRLSKGTKAKYGYFFNKFRTVVENNLESIDVALKEYNEDGFFKEFMINKKLEEF